MKTAMQELIDKVEHAISYNVEGGLVEKYTWEELFNDMYVLLEKEKEQIIKAHGLKYYDLNEETISGEQYYNETYDRTTDTE